MIFRWLLKPHKWHTRTYILLPARINRFYARISLYTLYIYIYTLYYYKEGELYTVRLRPPYNVIVRCWTLIDSRVVVIIFLYKFLNTRIMFRQPESVKIILFFNILRSVFKTQGAAAWHFISYTHPLTKSTMIYIYMG